MESTEGGREVVGTVRFQHLLTHLQSCGSNANSVRSCLHDTKYHADHSNVWFKNEEFFG